MRCGCVSMHTSFSTFISPLGSVTTIRTGTISAVCNCSSSARHETWHEAMRKLLHSAATNLARRLRTWASQSTWVQILVPSLLKLHDPVQVS